MLIAWTLSGLLWRSDRHMAAAAALTGNDPVAAVRQLERAVALYRWRPEGWGYLAEVRSAAAGSDPAGWEQARGEALRAVELDSYTPFRHFLAGRIAFALGDDGAALISLRRAVRLYPIKKEYLDGLVAVEERLDARDGS